MERILTTEDVSRIPGMRDKGMTWSAIALTFGVSLATARQRCMAQFPEMRVSRGPHQRRADAREEDGYVMHDPPRYAALTVGELTAQPVFFEQRITMRRLMAGR